ncbi:MAG: MMPL family transporter [Gammaproteobacteria bacterium]|jgi:multidrug efflux pump subunit AcrB|nr:MMPL family transporter [Gammaproteobacteria bacterium]
MRVSGVTKEKGVIAWFAANHVAANLLMILIIVAGLISASGIRKETNPELELNRIQVRVPYLGAAPQEVEEGVVIKIEEAIQDLPGIKRIRSNSREGMGNVTIELKPEADLTQVLGDVKRRVDAISTFPALTENPVIYKQEINNPVVMVALNGDLTDLTRKALGNEIRDELLQLPSVNKINYFGDRPYEISIQVSERTLREYGLTMSEISQAIRNSSIDMPGGTIKSEGGDILLRTKGQVYTGQDFGSLVLRTFPDGRRLTLNDIAEINDGFVESDGYSRFNGQPTATLQVVAGSNQNEIETAKAVKEYVAKKSETLPEGIRLDVWIDLPKYLEGGLARMQNNIISGAILVFVVLSLFLRMKVAFWVIVGLPVTFLGALWLMPIWPVTINTISLFGFIIVLGIVVDDAIIIGESAYTKIREDGHTLDNVIQGAHRVAIPATFGVLTTIAAFAPMMFIGGVVGPFFEAMAFVVILCLSFSLIESKLILPAHLVNAHIPPVDEDDLFRPQRVIGFFERIPRAFLKVQRHVQHGLQSVIHKHYRPMLERAVDNRGLTLSIFSAILILTIGLMTSGIARVVVFPDFAQDFIQVNLEMQSGTAPHIRNAAVDKVEGTLLEINRKFVAENPDSLPIIQNIGVFTTGDTGARMFVEIPFTEDRPYEMKEVTQMWREAVGEIPGMKELKFIAAGHIGGGSPLSFKLSGSNYTALEAAAADLARELATYEGLFDITNSAVSGSDEIKLTIKPEAEALGLTMSSLGRQVRQAFYGEEAQRIQRGKDELRVMVRYPIEERRSIADLENMRIRTPDGDEVPFNSVAEVSFGQGYSNISRLDRERTVTVSSDLDPEQVEPQQIVRAMSEEYIPELLSRYPGVKYGLEGSSQDQVDFMSKIFMALVIAMFLIYALIAIPLRSYSQPLIIMSVIPFGAIGAVMGHIIMGRSISMFSLFGLIALAGVVVNDSLIMVDFINKARVRGLAIRDAVIQSGTARFRAIILTSFTTAAGLLPIMFESSPQAQAIIPTAISIGYGIIFATIITLFLIPALYLLQEDFFRRMSQLKNWLLYRPAEVQAD